MSAQRLAGAPRLIEWTGERCVPWAPDVPVIYEHFHRYLWASRLVGGRTVLDLASGEGFGAALLAESAQAVVGIDIDERAVEHSRLNYRAANLEFRTGDAQDLSSFEPRSVGAVVAFEMIEHVADQDRVLSEIARVLAPDGLLIMSTPERDAYRAATGTENAFHTRELTEAEFDEFLRSRFSRVVLWGQRTITGSAVAPLEEGAAGGDGRPQLFLLERGGEEWRLRSNLSPMFMIAAASNVALPAIAPHSTLVDPGMELVHATRSQLEAVQAALQAAEVARGQLDAELSRTGEQLRQASMDLDAERQLTRQLRERADHHAAERAAIEARFEAQLLAAQRLNDRVQGSVTWQLFQRVRRQLYRVLGGERSRAARALQSSLRAAGRVTLRDPRAAAPADTDRRSLRN